MGQRREEDALEVGEDVFEGLAFFRCPLGKRVAHVTWRDVRQDRVTPGPAQILRNPLHERIPVAPEFGRIQREPICEPLYSWSRTSSTRD